jgi:hypothetical protein
MTSAAHQATEPSPLLSVIYPVFDVRGDAVERIRLWTENRIWNRIGTGSSLSQMPKQASTKFACGRFFEVTMSFCGCRNAKPISSSSYENYASRRPVQAGRAGASDCRCFLSDSSPTIATDYFPGHDGLRFSPNALRPSLASSVIASKAIWLSV